MFIEEVIIDGFKSYATRTVVSGFDPYFNAITGLNGSGKSNILDAICFVLGIRYVAAHVTPNAEKCTAAACWLMARVERIVCATRDRLSMLQTVS